MYMHELELVLVLVLTIRVLICLVFQLLGPPTPYVIAAIVRLEHSTVLLNVNVCTVVLIK